MGCWILQSKKIVLFILAVILIRIVFVFLTPAGRYGDDVVYMSVAKTIALTGDIAPVQDLATGTPFYGPPLQMWLLAFTYLISFGNMQAWLLLSKLMESVLQSSV